MKFFAPVRYFPAAAAALFLIETATSPLANAQFGKFKERLVKTTFCSGNAFGTSKLSDKITDFEVKRLGISPQAAAQMRHQYQLGLAMALCNGGSMVAGTTFGQMSERDKKKREDEMNAAVSDAAPGSKTYALPDHPQMTETITTQVAVEQSSNECRVVEDHLADGSKGDSALVKYCHTPPDGQWNVSTGV